MGLKISAMDAASTPLTGDEEVELSIPGSEPATAKATVQDIADLGRPTVTALASSSGAVGIDASLGDYFTLALTENVTSITFSNVPGGASLMIQITQDSTARTVAWPASFTWASGEAGTVSTGDGDVDLLAITTLDGGTTWRATLGKVFA